MKTYVFKVVVEPDKLKMAATLGMRPAPRSRVARPGATSMRKH